MAVAHIDAATYTGFKGFLRISWEAFFYLPWGPERPVSGAAVLILNWKDKASPVVNIRN